MAAASYFICFWSACLRPCQIVGHVLHRFAIDLVQMGVCLFVFEGSTIIHLALTYRFLLARISRVGAACRATTRCRTKATFSWFNDNCREQGD